MKILTLSCRVHSLEYVLFLMPEEEEICWGVVEKIGEETAVFKHYEKGKKEEKIIAAHDHKKALEKILGALPLDKREIAAVGHRVIHGGEKYLKPVIIDEAVKREIYQNFELAPLHNPYNFAGIEAVEGLLPGVPQVAMFDTSFHQTLPPVAYRYPLPELLYPQQRIRRYGFHGISHRWVLERTAELLGKKIKEMKMISVHLGAGGSLCAIKEGKSIDTTMGFTPLEGLMMTTRSGDIDPGIIFYLQRIGWSINKIESCLNRESGVLGVSGISHEMKEVVEEMKKGNKKAKEAVEMYVYRVRKYLGAYYLVLGGVEAICFTGGIGENSSLIRNLICQDLGFLGIKLDKKRNEKTFGGKEGEISLKNSKVKVFVIPGREKLLMARVVFSLVKKRKKK